MLVECHDDGARGEAKRKFVAARRSTRQWNCPTDDEHPDRVHG